MKDQRNRQKLKREHMKEMNKQRNEHIKNSKQPNISEETKKLRSKQTNKLTKTNRGAKEINQQRKK